MRGWLRFDAPWIQVLSWFTDFILLNFMFVFCSLPIVSIGASSTAMHSVMHYYFDTGKQGRVSRFWDVYRKEMKRTIQVWFPALLAGIVLVTDLGIVFMQSFTGQFLILSVLFVCIVVYFGIISWLFPTLAMNNGGKISAKELYFKAWKNSLDHLLVTLFMMTLNVTPLILYMLFWEYYIHLSVIMILAGFSILFYLESLVLHTASIWRWEMNDLKA